MAFPSIPTVAAGRVLSNTQANNTALRTFPSLSGLTKNSGDLLIAICVVYQSSAASGAVFSGWGAGFTEFLDVGGTTSNLSIGAAYKYSTGSETGTFTVTQAATVTGHAAMILMSIPGANQSIVPVASTISVGTVPNVPALNPPTWGTLDTLWIAVAASGETATAGSYDGISSAPPNYTNYVDTGISADVVGGVEGAVAFRQLNAVSEDPTVFDIDSTNARNATVLLAVCPAPTSVTLTPAVETDSAQAVAAATTPNFVSITTAAETDAAGTIVPLQPLPATVAASALPLSTQSGHNITTSTTTASAQALDVDKKVTITLAAETDSVPSTRKSLTPATETDSALVLTVLHANFTVTPATETDLAGDIITFQPLPAQTTDTPQVLTVTQGGVHLTPVTTTASAQLLGFTQGGGYAITRATETDLANQIVSLQPLPANVTASAQPLSVIYGGKNIAPALESDSARSVAPGAGINLVEWETTAPIPYNTKAAVGDVSSAVVLSITSGVGSNKSITFVTETNSAQALTVHKQATITLVSVTASAQTLTKSKSYNITTSTSTALAVGLIFSQLAGTTYTIGVAGSTETATSVSILKEILMALGIASTTMTARTVRAANRPSGGLVLIDHDPDIGLVLIDHVDTSDLALIDI